MKFLDSLKLPIDFNYNLNVVKEIQVTESYLTLEEDIRKCNKEETFDDCANHLYIDTFIKKCNCLPLRLQLKNEVKLLLFLYLFEKTSNDFRNICVLQVKLNVQTTSQ